MPRSARLLAPALLALCFVPAASDAASTDPYSSGLYEPTIRLGADSATNIASDGVTLRGTVDSDFSAVTVKFQYGTANTLDQSTTAYNTQGLGFQQFRFSQTVAGLAPGTTYIYRMVAKPYGVFGDSNPRYSETRSFVTTAVSGSGGSGSGGSGSGGSGSGGSGSSGSGSGSGIVTPLPLPVPIPSPTITTEQTPSGDAPPTPAKSSPDPAPAASAAPEAGQSVGVAPSKGTVLVRRPGTGEYVALAAGSAVPMGSVVDTRKGQVALTSEMPGGKTQTGYFNGGLFVVRQSRDGTVDLYLQGPVCQRPAASRRRGLATASLSRAAGRKPGRRGGRRLFGRDKGGKFRTHGRNSHATVRGTKWLVEDRCDGTVTKVTEGAVMVKDLTTKRRTLVKAGGRYLARAPR